MDQTPVPSVRERGMCCRQSATVRRFARIPPVRAPQAVIADVPGPSTVRRGAFSRVASHRSNDHIVTAVEIVDGTWASCCGPRRAGIVGLVGLAVGACATAPTVSSDWPLVQYERGAEESVLDSAVEGQLTIVGGCVALRSPDGELATVVWPDDADWLWPKPGIRWTPLGGDTVVVEVGDSVRLTGLAGESEPAVRWLRRPSPDCPERFVVVG